MDQLALFFATDIGSSDTVHIKDKSRTTKRTKHPEDISFSTASHETSMVKNNSLPCVASAQQSHNLTQSHSFPGSGSLPLDLPPEPEEGNIEYKVRKEIFLTIIL